MMLALTMKTVITSMSNDYDDTENDDNYGAL